MNGFLILWLTIAFGQGLCMLLLPGLAREIYIGWRGAWGIIISPDSPMLSNPAIRFFGILSIAMGMFGLVVFSQAADDREQHASEFEPVELHEWIQQFGNAQADSNAPQAQAASNQRGRELLDVYYATHTPDYQHSETLQSAYLGDAGRYALLAYSFTRSGPRTTIRSTHQLLVFDAENEAYLMMYYLPDQIAPDATDVMNDKVIVTLMDGSRLSLDFSEGLPATYQRIGPDTPSRDEGSLPPDE